MAKATLATVYNYFAGDGMAKSGDVVKPTDAQKKEYPLAQFRMDWAALDLVSKEQIATGIGDSSQTY